MREYHFCNSSGSSVTGAPHPRVLRVGVLVWNSDVQLLPAVAVARDSASKKLVRQGTARGSPKFVSVSTSGPLVTFPFSVHCDSRLSTCCDLCIESERSLCPTSPHRNALSRRCLPSRE